MKKIPVICLLIGIYLLSGIRILNQKDYCHILDSRILPMTPVLIKRRLAYAPFPFLSIYKYGKREQHKFLQELKKPFKSKEGSEFFIKGKVSFHFDEERIIPAHSLIRKNGLYPVSSEIFYETLQKIFGSILIPKPENQMRWLQLSKEAEQALALEMEKYGIVLKSFQLDSLIFEGDLKALPRPLDTKILFIGLDGVGWNILDPLMDAGKLPHLKKLKDNGSSGRLLTVAPTLSPIIWTTIATGKKPEKHGIMDFLAIDERTGKRVPITSNIRRAKAIWNILSDFGLRVSIVGWWATWPAEKVNGYMVTDRVAYQLFGISSSIESSKGKTYPPELYSDIRPLIMEPESISWKEMKKFFDPEISLNDFHGEKRRTLEEMKTLYASGETFKNIFHFLDERNQSDFQALYFEGTDTISHLLMPYRKPKMEGISQEEIRMFGDSIDRYYQYIDEVIGKIIEKKDENWTIFICSDHGFKTGKKRPLSFKASIAHGKAAQWHERYGILIVSGKHIKKGFFIDEGRVLDLLPTILALYGLPVGADMDGRVLSELFLPEFLEAHPVQYHSTYEKEVYVARSKSPIESDMDEDIKEKLLSLGYISQDSDNSFNNRGLVLMSKGEYEGAIHQFQKALQRNPSFTAARINLGIAKMQKKDLDEAISIFLEVLRNNPENSKVENLLGNAYMNKRDYHQAEKHFMKALSIEPSDTDVLNSLGILYEKMGRSDEAIKEYKKVIEIDPFYAEGYNNIGNIWKKRGHYQKALHWYERAIKADPFFIGSYNNMALIYQERGHIEKAIQLFAEALEKSPTNAIVMNNLGSLYFQQGDVDMAMKMWKKSIEMVPGYESPYNNLGAAYGKKKMYDKEIEMYQKALHLKSDYIDARQNLALAYIRKGESEKAIKEILKITGTDPGYMKAWVLAARTYFEMDDYHKGLEILEKALKYNPENALLLNMAGEASLYAGNEKKALNFFNRSLMIDPDQDIIKKKVQSLKKRMAIPQNIS